MALLSALVVRAMIALLAELKSRCTIFIIEHTMKVIRELADRVVHFQQTGWGSHEPSPPPGSHTESSLKRRVQSLHAQLEELQHLLLFLGGGVTLCVACGCVGGGADPPLPPGCGGWAFVVPAAAHAIARTAEGSLALRRALPHVQAMALRRGWRPREPD